MLGNAVMEARDVRAPPCSPLSTDTAVAMPVSVRTHLAPQGKPYAALLTVMTVALPRAPLAFPNDRLCAHLAPTGMFVRSGRGASPNQGSLLRGMRMEP